MELLLYTTIFLIGIILGNFSYIAINRIIKNDKEIKNSKDKKIRNIVSLLIGTFISLKVTWKTMTILTLIEYLYIMIFIITLIIIAGVDYKNKKIYKPIIFLGAIIGFVHILYLYRIQNLGMLSIYKYIIYFIIICILTRITEKNIYFKYSYILDIMIICMYMNMFVISEVFWITVALTMISIIISIIIKKQKNKIDKSDILAETSNNIEIPIGMYLCISNIIAMMIQAIEIKIF